MENGNLTISQKQLGKVIADAIFKVWDLHGKIFPDFDTIGQQTASIITERFENIERNPAAYKKYFQRELFTSGAASLHIKKEIPTDQNIGAAV